MRALDEFFEKGMVVLAKKDSTFYPMLDAAIWSFVCGLTRQEVMGLELIQGTGWSKYVLKNKACTVTILSMPDGILLTSWTDLNPTVRELDYYTRQDGDDYEAVVSRFVQFLTTLWADSIARERLVRLFGVCWPKI